MGFMVITAEDGKAALERMKEEKPDITILDIMMPALGGLSVLKQIRDEEDTADLPVIVLTAKGQHKDISKELEGEATDYITKPIDIDEVVTRVSEILERS